MIAFQNIGLFQTSAGSRVETRLRFKMRRATEELEGDGSSQVLSVQLKKWKLCFSAISVQTGSAYWHVVC